jgi:hypothetical protein
MDTIRIFLIDFSANYGYITDTIRIYSYFERRLKDMEKKLKFDFETTQKLIRYIGFIDSFKGKWRSSALKNNRILKELRRIATVESIGSSTRIEGSAMTNEEIEKFLKNLRIKKFETRDEQEVAGYYQALETIFENYQNIDMTENYIKQLHGILLREAIKIRAIRAFIKNCRIRLWPIIRTARRRSFSIRQSLTLLR